MVQLLSGQSVAHDSLQQPVHSFRWLLCHAWSGDHFASPYCKPVLKQALQLPPPFRIVVSQILLGSLVYWK